MMFSFYIMRTRHFCNALAFVSNTGVNEQIPTFPFMSISNAKLSPLYRNTDFTAVISEAVSPGILQICTLGKHGNTCYLD